MAGRLSTNQIFERTQTNIATARERELISSEKAATGKEVVRPSQDPAGYMVSSNIKDDLSALNTNLKTAASAVKVLDMTENIFSSLQDTMQRVGELAVAAAGEGVSSDANRKFTASEVNTLYDSALQLLNTRYANRTLLAGFRSDRPAFDPKGNFLGDNGSIEIEIASGLRIPVNISASRAVLGNGIENGINLLEPVQKFIEGLRTNDTEMIQSTLDGFQRVNDQISLVRGEIGSRTSQIGRAISTQEQIQVDGTAAVSQIEDADAIKVFSELSRDQTVLQAAIATSKKILSENPTDIFYK
jgi:flagellar hook-associated protein 3 FlgL